MIAMPRPAYAAAAISFVLTLALTPAVRALCTRLQIFDAPGPLKIHAQPVPRLGGAAVFIAIFAAVVFASPRGPSVAAFLAALSLVWLAGFLDDLRHLSPAIRVAAQCAAGALVWLGGWRLSILGSSSLGLIAVCIAIPAFANAFNLFDGMDGLATGTAAIIAFAYLALPAGTLSPIARVVAASFAGACLGFLPANWPTAKIFLGDEGSTLLGFTIAFLGVDICRARSSSPSALAFPLLIAAVPLLDAGLAAIRRVRRRSSPLFGDRRHVYDLIRARVCSVPKILALLYGITAAMCALALLLVYKPSEGIAVAAAVAAAILIVAGVKLGSLEKGSAVGAANLLIGVVESTSPPAKSTASKLEYNEVHKAGTA
jgi:UDP-GlcNAc:undecaprenyl-phosphate GlcNAc-1-phosphate transferase